MKKLFSEFKKFISKGNIIDLAVALVIGSAFNKIVSSLVANIITPLISLAVGGLNVSDWKIVLREATYNEAGEIVTAENAIGYGIFLQAILDFLIIAICIFIAVKLVKKLHTEIQEGIEKAQAAMEARKKDDDEETPAAEAAPEAAPATPATPAEVPAEAVSDNEEIKSLLREIRDIMAQSKNTPVSSGDNGEDNNRCLR